jgi:dTDP-4-amino-4,6-dideoxygalactose transaminase
MTSAPNANNHVPFLDLTGTTREVLADVTRAWTRLLDGNRFIGGVEVEEFEARWAAYCGTTHAIGVANGTDALHLVLRSLGIGAGDEVIVPTNSFVATAEAVVLAGATPRFADVDPDTLQLTVANVEAVRTRRTRAVIVVHLYGQMGDVDALTAYSQHAGLLLIEDAAQAHGATWRAGRAGSFGVAGCFSFYPGKNLGAFGDGGAVVTSDAALAARIRSMRDHGRVPGSHYDHGMVGTNSRLDAMQAAVLNAKLGCLDRWNEARRRIMAQYRHALEDGEFHLVAEVPASQGVVHLAVLRAPDRPAMRSMLSTLGVDTGVHYPIPLHRLAQFTGLATRSLPAAEQAARSVVSLPMFPHMTDRQVAAVCRALTTAMNVNSAQVVNV